jgi:hypothetical protein
VAIDVKDEFRLALQAVLNAWLDAVVIRDTPAAVEILKVLESTRKGSVRLLTLDAPPSALAPKVGQLTSPQRRRTKCVRPSSRTTCRTSSHDDASGSPGTMRMPPSASRPQSPLPANGTSDLKSSVAASPQ